MRKVSPVYFLNVKVQLKAQKLATLIIETHFVLPFGPEICNLETV